METHQQCILFKLNKPDFEAFILLPEMYIREHSGLRTLLQQRNIHVLDEENVSQCIPNEGESVNVEIVEIFMKDPPASSELRFTIPHYRQWMRIIPEFFPGLKHLNSANIRWPDLQTLRPAVDDSNFSVFTRILEHNPAMPIQIRRDPSMSMFFKKGRPIRLLTCRKSEAVGSFLHLAACRGHVSFARLLLEYGLDVNRESENELSPLHFAIRGKSPAMVALLLEHGADPMCDDPETGFIPLQECYDFKVTEILLTKALDPDLAFQRAWTSFEACPSWKDRGPLEAMLNYGAHVDNCVGEVSLLTRVRFSSEGNSSVIALLLERCYLNFERLKKAVNWKIRYYPQNTFYDVLFFHIFKVAALEDKLSDDICRRICESGYCTNLDKFIRECKEEVLKLKSSNLGDTAVSYFELLALDEHKIARLLTNESVAQIGDLEEVDLLKRFPVYGRILSIQFKKGKLRSSIQVEGIRSFGLVSSLFRSLYDELKEVIVAHLNLIDVVRLREASTRPEIVELA